MKLVRFLHLSRISVNASSMNVRRYIPSLEIQLNLLSVDSPVWMDLDAGTVASEEGSTQTASARMKAMKGIALLKTKQAVAVRPEVTCLRDAPCSCHRLAIGPAEAD